MYQEKRFLNALKIDYFECFAQIIIIDSRPKIYITDHFIALLNMRFTRKTTIVKHWELEGHPDYFFTVEKKLFRVTSTGKAVESRMAMVGYTKGYYLKSKFYSTAKIDAMLRVVA
jgi:hypothetical protein